MKTEETYANGQKKAELKDDIMTHFFNDGTVKAKGLYKEDQMQGEWNFYKKTGHLWQVGHFKDNQKHGPWIRYDADGHIEYSETFEEGQIVKK